MTVGRRHRGSLVVACVVAVLGASCTSEAPLPEPVEVETCAGLEDVGVRLVEVWVEVVDQIPFDSLTADPPPQEISELARIGRDLDARAARLGCDAAELNATIRQRVLDDGNIDPATPVGEMLLELVGEGIVGRLPAPPSTTAATVAP